MIYLGLKPELSDPTSSKSLLLLGLFLVDSMLRCQNKQERKQINETPYQVMEKLQERSVSGEELRSNWANKSGIVTSCKLSSLDNFDGGSLLIQI